MNGSGRVRIKHPAIHLAFVWLSLSLAACTLNQAAGGSQAWIDAPLTGSVLPINTSVEVVSHSSDPAGIDSVELSINNAVVSTDGVPGSGQSYVLMKQKWTPTAAGSYQVRVRARSSSGQWSQYATVIVGVKRAPDVVPSLRASETPAARSTLTPQPTLTASAEPPSPTASAQPLAPTAPTLSMTENAFCRQGADTSFPDITAIPAGETVDIKGVSADGFWYFVFWQKFSVRCWVAASTGQVSGDVSGITVINSPPTPGPSPTPTRRAP